VKEQFAVQHHYQCEQKTVAGVESIWYVFDGRHEGTADRRSVHVRDTVMVCSCCFPITYLLPCRHVLRLNLQLYKAAFRSGQVGKRWLRYFKPQPSAPADLTLRAAVPDGDPVDNLIPADLESFVQPGLELSRRGRYGQLMGYCQTICSIGSEHKTVFFDALKDVQALVRRLEAATAESAFGSAAQLSPATSSPRPTIVSSSSSSSPAVSSPSASSALSSSSSSSLAAADAVLGPEVGMHPTVAINQLTIPPHRKKQLGRG
jgi:hypothetical protein